MMRMEMPASFDGFPTFSRNPWFCPYPSSRPRKAKCFQLDAVSPADTLYRPRMGTPFKFKIAQRLRRRLQNREPSSASVPQCSRLEPNNPPNALSRSVSLPESVFQAQFDLKSFQPSEISVKVQDQTLVVEANHSSSERDGHYAQHQYIRKVPFPTNVAPDNIKCILDQLGRLQIEAPMDADDSAVTQTLTTSTHQNSQPTEPTNSEVVIEDIGPE